MPSPPSGGPRPARLPRLPVCCARPRSPPQLLPLIDTAGPEAGAASLGAADSTAQALVQFSPEWPGDSGASPSCQPAPFRRAAGDDSRHRTYRVPDIAAPRVAIRGIDSGSFNLDDLGRPTAGWLHSLP